MKNETTWKSFGTAQTRDEDARLVRGAGSYAGDIDAEGALWMHIVRSDHVAGRIVTLDVEAARKAPGVVAVLTDADQGDLTPFPLRFVPPGTEVTPTPFLPLAQRHVHFAGEAVAAIIAETQSQALDAAELIDLDIDETEAVVDARKAAADDAPRVWDDRDSNIVFDQELGDRATFDAALAAAAHTVTARIEISRVAAVSMEPRNALAVPLEGGRTRLHTGTQAPHRVKLETSQVLGTDPDLIQVQLAEIGGSFGMRNGAYPEDVLLVMASRRTGRPVRWQATRSDSFLSDTQSREMSVDVTLALDADHRFLAIGLDGYAPVGAQIGPMAMHPMASNLPGIVGVYRTPVIHTRLRGVHVNSMHMAPYRGAGRPEAIYIVERIADIAAHRLGLDRVALRRKNLITPDQMPYETPLGYVYDSGDFPAALSKGLAAADWAGFDARRADAEARGMLRGIGLACSIEPAGAGPKDAQLPEYGAIHISPDTGLTLSVGSGDSGQGHATAFAQIAEHLLGWRGKVTVITGDTDVVPKGVGTFGSRTMGAAAQALSHSASTVIAQALPDAADMLEVATADIVFEDGAYRIIGTDRALTLEGLSHKTGKSYAADAFVPADAGTFPNGAHICEVEVDPGTGALSVERYTVIDDVGTVINPLLVEGQVHGGVAQGLGQALMEQIVYDPQTGALLSGSLMDYAMPRADDLPSLSVHHSPTPTTSNALGVKGAGESGTVGALPAVMNAVCHVLSQRGVESMDMPATPARIWTALRKEMS